MRLKSDWNKFLAKFLKKKKKYIPRHVEEINVKDQKIFIETYKSFVFDFGKFSGISSLTLKNLYPMYGLHFNTPYKNLTLEVQKELAFDLKNILTLNKLQLEQIIYFRLLHHQNAQTFRGFRHFVGLPSNGQRTSSNANNKRYGFRKELVKKIRRAERLSENWS